MCREKNNQWSFGWRIKHGFDIPGHDKKTVGSITDVSFCSNSGFRPLHFAFFLCLLLSHAYFAAGSWWHFTIFTLAELRRICTSCISAVWAFWALPFYILLDRTCWSFLPIFLLDSAWQPCWTLFCSCAFGPFTAYFTLQEWPLP